MGAKNELLNRKGKRVHRAFCLLSPLNKLVIFPGARALQSGTFERLARVASHATQRSLAK